MACSRSALTPVGSRAHRRRSAQVARRRTEKREPTLLSLFPSLSFRRLGSVLLASGSAVRPRSLYRVYSSEARSRARLAECDASKRFCEVRGGLGRAKRRRAGRQREAEGRWWSDARGTGVLAAAVAAVVAMVCRGAERRAASGDAGQTFSG